MKRCKAEYLLIKMTLLKYLICKGCTFYLGLFRLAEKMFTMHTLHAFGWIFFYHLEGCDSINFIDKKSLTLYCLITWNDNYALLVIHYCRECQSCGTTQFNNSNPTLDNLTQITIALCTYTHLHVDWPT